LLPGRFTFQKGQLLGMIDRPASGGSWRHRVL
jgi:hypothetical protein